MTDSFSGPQLILLGGAILVIGFLLRRSFVNGKRSRERDPAAEARAELRTFEKSAESSVRNMEVRLHNYGREVEGRVQTTLTLLDRLILEAEQETSRLEQLLADSGRAVEVVAATGVAETAGAPLSGEECNMVRDLCRAGYALPQIARLLRRGVDEVRAAADASADGGLRERGEAA